MALFNKSFLERLASLLALGLIVVVFAQPAPLFPADEEDESEQEAGDGEEPAPEEEDGEKEGSQDASEEDSDPETVASDEDEEVIVEDDGSEEEGSQDPSEEDSDAETVAKGSQDASEEDSDAETVAGGSQDASEEDSDAETVASDEDEEVIVEDDGSEEAPEKEAEEEFELDEDGNRLLDEDGNPIPKRKADGGKAVEYELDEDGNPVLDEDGKPIPKRKGAKDVVGAAFKGDAGAAKGAVKSMAKDQLKAKTGIKTLNKQGIQNAAAEKGTAMALGALGLGGEKEGEDGKPAQEPEEAPTGPIKTVESLTEALEYVQRNVSVKINRDAALAKLGEVVSSWNAKSFKDQASALYSCFTAAKDAMKAPGGKLNVAALGGAKPAQHAVLLDAVSKCLSRQAIVSSFTTSQVDELYTVLMEATKGSKGALALPALDKDYTALPAKMIEVDKVRASLMVQKACGAKVQLRAKSMYVAGTATLLELVKWFGEAKNKALAAATMPELDTAGFFGIVSTAVVLAKTQMSWTMGSASWSGKEQYAALADLLKAVKGNKEFIAKLSGEAQAIVTKYGNEADKKAGRVLSIVGKAETVAADLGVISAGVESGVTASETRYVQAMTDLVKVVGVVKAADVKTYATEVYTIIDKAVKMLNLRGTLNPMFYKKPATYTTVFACLKAVTKSLLYAEFTQQQKDRVQTIAIDVQAKIPGAVIDISPFVQGSVISDPVGFVIITDRMLGNKTQYVAAHKHINMMLQPGSKAKPADVEKVVTTAKTKMAWVITNRIDFTGKDLFKALTDTCVNALNKWQAAFGAPMSAPFKTLVVDTAIRAQAKSGTVVSFSASSVRTDKGLAPEGTLCLQIGALQAAVKASKAATFASAGDNVIALVKALGSDNVSADIVTQVYLAVKAVKAECAWTFGNLHDYSTASAYTVVYKVVSAALPFLAKNAAYKAEAATWLSNAATKIKEKGGTVPAATVGGKTETEAKGTKVAKGTGATGATTATTTKKTKKEKAADKAAGITSTTAVAPKKTKAVAAANVKSEKAAAFAAAKTPEEKAALAAANKKAKTPKATTTKTTKSLVIPAKTDTTITPSTKKAKAPKAPKPAGTTTTKTLVMPAKTDTAGTTTTKKAKVPKASKSKGTAAAA